MDTRVAGAPTSGAPVTDDSQEPTTLFYTGPLVNAEMLVVMLEKHGITARQEFEDPSLPDEGDLSRPTNVLVTQSDFAGARRLFYTEREDEL